MDSIVLEIPDSDPFLHAGRQVAVWSVTKLAADAGGWRQVNRAGFPMIWPIFRPDYSAYASESNTTHPADDRANDGERLAGRISAVAAAYGSADPAAYAGALVQRLLPDLLPFRVGTSAALSFAGINGRTLADNAPEVMFSLATNTRHQHRADRARRRTCPQRPVPYVKAAGAAVPASARRCAVWLVLAVVVGVRLVGQLDRLTHDAVRQLCSRAWLAPPWSARAGRSPSGHT